MPINLKDMKVKVNPSYIKRNLQNYSQKKVLGWDAKKDFTINYTVCHYDHKVFNKYERNIHRKYNNSLRIIKFCQLN